MGDIHITTDSEWRAYKLGYVEGYDAAVARVFWLDEALHDDPHTIYTLMRTYMVKTLWPWLRRTTPEPNTSAGIQV